jgi:hypothetical protein
MEEADLDELEWMACQQFPPEEDEDLYDGYADVPPPPDDPPGTFFFGKILGIPKFLHCRVLLIVIYV